LAIQELPRDAGALDTTALVSLGSETELVSGELNSNCLSTCISGPFTIVCDGTTF
jgi:hypothetical protein